MTLQELYKELQMKCQGDTFVLTSDTAEGGYRMLLSAAAVSALTVRKAQISYFGGGIEICGASDFLASQSIEENGFLLRTTVNEYGVILYNLTITARGQKRFGDFFGSLPQSLFFDGKKQVYRECVYADFIISYPVVTIDDESVFESMPFRITGTVSLQSSGVWKRYADILPEKCPAEGVFAMRNSPLGRRKALIDLKLPLTHKITLPAIGEAKLALRLCSVKADAYTFAQEPYFSKSFLIFLTSVKNLTDSIAFYTELFSGNYFLTLGAAFPKGLSIGNIVNFFVSLFDIEETSLLLPENTFLNTFGLKELQLDFSQSDERFADSLEHIRITCGLERPWDMPVPYVTMKSLTAVWEMSWLGEDVPLTSLYAAARFSMKLGKIKFLLDAGGYLPQMRFFGELNMTEHPALSDMMESFNVAAPKEWNAGEKQLVSARVMLDVPERIFAVDANIGDVLEFHIGSLHIALEGLEISAEIGPSLSKFRVGGTFGFGEGEDYFSFALRADYDKGWLFKGTLLSGEVNIGKLIWQMFQIPVSGEELFRVVLDDFSVEYETGTGRFSLTASFYTSWFTVLGVTPKLGGRILLKKEDSKQEEFYGSALAYVDVEIFRILVQLDDFYSKNPSWLFRLEFGGSYLCAAYERDEREDEILTVSMGGTTLGGLVEAFVNLINPNAKFTLPAPWNLLNKIELSRFLLIFNTTKKTVSFLYQVDLDIAGLMQIKKVGLKYEKKSGKNTLRFILTGRLLTEEYTESAPLSWDVLDEKPPENKASNGIKLEVYYVGIGQHLDTGGVVRSDSIREALNELKKQITPDTSGGLLGLKYSKDADWLFGVDFKISDMFRFGMVLNDPALYGALIQVEASEESPLAMFNGLSFELLYKKISDETGMFRISFMMPERFRRFELGIITIMLGQIIVEIYTNGSFLVDFGFPHQDDYGKSFGLEFYIFTGKGGVYFGAFKGDAAKSVPQIVNGAFTPVLLLGIGLRVGLGRSFDLGIVKAGVALELFGIFEGVLAFFKPDEESVRQNPEVKEAVYYRVRAKAGIMGCLFLSVDLKIITLNVTAEIMVWCELVLESCRKAEVEMELSLKLEAKIKILFFKISFSFHFRQNVSFTFGEDEKTPWILQEECVNRRMGICAEMRNGRLEEHVFRTDKIGDWSINVKYSPLVSVTEPVFRTADAGSLDYCVAFLGVIAREDFFSFYTMMVQWILAGWDGETVSCEMVQALKRAEQSVDYDSICRFFDNNLQMRAELAAAVQNEEKEGGVFPMLPQIILRVGEKETDYSRNLADGEYIRALWEYFERLRPQMQEQKTVLEEGLEESLPLAAVIMTDWVRLILSEILRRLKNIYQSLEVWTEDLLDTAESCHTGMTELLRANPDVRLSLHVFPKLSYIIREGDTFASIWEKYELDIEDMWTEVGEKAGIIRQGAVFETGRIVFDNRDACLTEGEAAVFFFVRLHPYEIDSVYSRYADTILKENQQLTGDWECLKQGGQPIRLPGGRTWRPVPGDTVERLAKCVLMWEKTAEGAGSALEEWMVFRESFAAQNGGDESGVLDCYEFAGSSYIDGDLTANALFRRVYWDDFEDRGSLSKTGLWGQDILSPLSSIGLLRAKTKVTDTASEILGKGFCSIDELAAALETGGGALETRQRVKILSVPELEKETLREILITQDHSGEIMAIVSRFFLQGLRVPKPEEKIRERVRKGQSSGTTGLYQLLGQQFSLLRPEEDHVLALKKGSPACTWLQVDEEEKLLTAETIRKLLPSGIRKVLQGPRQRQAFGKSARCWTLSRLSKLRECREQKVFYRSVAILPEDLQNYIRTAKEMPVLKVNQTETKDFFFGCMLEIELEKENGDGLYYVYGIAAPERGMLRRLINSGISSLRIAYLPSELDSDAGSYVSDDFSDNSVLVKTNTSRETHMYPIYRRNEPDKYRYSATLGQPDCFLRLLWECSVIGGGYYLKLLGAKLPDGIWDENQRAKICILSLYDGQRRTQITSNCIVTGKQVENATLYSKELLEDVPLLPPGYVGVELEMEGDGGEDTPQGRMDSLYQIAGYRIMGGDVEESRDSLPVLPQQRQEGGAQYYLAAIPLYRFAGEGVSYYGAVSKRADIAVEIRDVLGNRGEFACERVTGTYNDLVMGINRIPATAFSYAVMSGEASPLLVIRAEFLKDEKPAAKSAETLSVMLWQLGCEGMRVSVKCSFQKEELYLDERQFEMLIKYVRDVQEALSESNPADVVSDFVVSIPLSADEAPKEITPLTVTMTVRRPDAPLSYEPLENVLPKEARYAVSEIAPALNGARLESEPFILDFERAFQNLWLAQGADGWCCVPVGEGLIKDIFIRPYRCTIEGKRMKSPEYYSYMPLSTVRISRKTTATGADGSVAEYSYREIELDEWMQRFLHELESNVLSCRAACIAAGLCPEILERAVAAKEVLAGQLSLRVQTLRERPWTNDAEGKVDAFVRKRAEDYFRTDLELAYSTNVIAVYEAGFEASSYCRMELDIACKEDKTVRPSKLSTKEKAVCLFVDTGALRRAFSLNVDALLSNLEYNIQLEKDGYESSDWLRLVHPFGKEDAFVDVDFASDIMVPNPRKECPAAPSLLSQEILPAGFLRWSYRAVCQCRCFEQYSIYLKVRFSKERMQKNAAGRDLFDVLACYDQRREEILCALGKSGDEFAAAYEEMAHFAEEVSEVFPETGERLSEPHSGQEENEITVKIEIVQSDGVRFLAEPTADSRIQLERWGAELGDISLVSGGEAGELMQFSVVLENLPIYECQRAKASVWLLQNENIFRESKERVREGFIFRTEPVSSAELKVYQNYGVLRLPRSAGDNTAENTVKALWDYMEFDTGGISADISVWYLYPLIHGENMGIRLPVTFIPNAVNDTIQKDAAIVKTVENIRSWYRENRVEEGEGYLRFEITVYGREDSQTLLSAVVEA